MITERDKRLASIRASLDSNFHTTDRDILWLLDEIMRLDKALEAEQARNGALKKAMQQLVASHAVLLGVRNQMQARIMQARINELEEE